MKCSCRLLHPSASMRRCAFSNIANNIWRRVSITTNYNSSTSLVSFWDHLSGLRQPARSVRTLSSLLHEKTDVFLESTLNLDLPRIAELAKQPFLGQIQASSEQGASVRIEWPDSRDEEKRAQQQSSAQELQESVPVKDYPEMVEKSLLSDHLRCALCSVNAVLRVRIQTQLEQKVRSNPSKGTESVYMANLPAKDLDASFEVFDLVKKQRGSFSTEQWHELVKPELDEFKVLLARVNGARIVAF